MHNVSLFATIDVKHFATLSTNGLCPVTRDPSLAPLVCCSSSSGMITSSYRYTRTRARQFQHATGGCNKSQMGERGCSSTHNLQGHRELVGSIGRTKHLDLNPNALLPVSVTQNGSPLDRKTSNAAALTSLKMLVIRSTYSSRMGLSCHTNVYSA